MAAPNQAGVFGGKDPSAYNPQDPVVLFIIQASIILIFSRVLAVPLGWLRQPRVIAEVIAGIILGPSVLGRIPNYMDSIFPAPSLPFLNLVATLGLIFFLFEVGLEVDVRVIRRDWRGSIFIAVAGMALPFGLGIAASVGLYKLQNDPDVPFSSFMLFQGVALAITAFPVLARILAELKLLKTQVGALTMASGLLNDVTAWVLLALVVALLNAGNGLEVLWVLLTTLAFALFLIFLVRPLYRRLCFATGSIQNGPTPLLMTVTLVMVLASAFVTDIIGVHAIFGGFLAGVIIPHDGDLATKIAEKIEDIVNIIFLPLYFTLSGLQTQIGLLNTGEVWGYVILVIVLACFGKIVGCTVAAKLGGMTIRESFAVGFLMNCKGLVELIVLNIGHNAGVLNDQVFVIMVVMALVTTFMTTPFVMWLYPEWYQKQRAELRREAAGGSPSCKVSTIGAVSSVIAPRYKLVTMLNDLESVPSMMSVIRRYRQEGQEQLELHSLRLRELTDRATDIMKIRDERETLRFDPVLNVIRTFASLIGVNELHTRLEFLGRHEFLKVMSDYSESCDADIILLPCPSNLVYNSNDNLYDNNSSDDQLAHDPDQDFVKEALSIDRISVGLLIDRGLAASLPTSPSKQHSSKDTKQLADDPFGNMNIIVPIAGGADDRAALLFALRLKSSRTHILHVTTETNTTTGIQRYATMQSIKNTLATATPYTDDATFLNTLFVAGEPDASALVEYAAVEDERLTATTFTAHYATQNLTRQDLVIVGHESAQALGFPTQRFAFLTSSVLVVRASIKAGSSTATEQ
ncbi:k homeostasis protein [Lichtheimia corymbifera JMRC:FSU:9682]|uniref:K homeostasis protein n=1 Tax=Lichtheimia corymbifera JMRC:FSU:9682 TaxID=1263082 RepID=A0A068RLD3_9FUNG|nr:k homeostasis protein [Lichtheimia corymbifera JMRC:FSU:9682]